MNNFIIKISLYTLVMKINYLPGIRMPLYNRNKSFHRLILSYNCIPRDNLKLRLTTFWIHLFSLISVTSCNISKQISLSEKLRRIIFRSILFEQVHRQGGYSIEEWEKSCSWVCCLVTNIRIVLTHHRLLVYFYQVPFLSAGRYFCSSSQNMCTFSYVVSRSVYFSVY